METQKREYERAQEQKTRQETEHGTFIEKVNQEKKEVKLTMQKTQARLTRNIDDLKN